MQCVKYKCDVKIFDSDVTFEDVKRINMGVKVKHVYSLYATVKRKNICKRH